MLRALHDLSSGVACVQMARKTHPWSQCVTPWVLKLIHFGCSCLSWTTWLFCTRERVDLAMPWLYVLCGACVVVVCLFVVLAAPVLVRVVLYVG